jgi:hypothetical protein
MAAAIKRVFVDLLIIVVSILASILASSGNRFERIEKSTPSRFLNKSRTLFARQSYEGAVRRRTFSRDFVISRLALRDYLRVSV